MEVLFYVLFALGCCFIPRCEGQSTYYVKPTPETECPGQPCETLQHYIDNINASNSSSLPTVNIYYDEVFVVFLNGTHGINTSSESAIDIYLFQSILRITGQGNVTIQCLLLFYSCPLIFNLLDYSEMYIDGLSLVFALDIGITDYFDSDAPGFLSLSSITFRTTKLEIVVIQAYFDDLVVTHQSLHFTHGKDIRFHETMVSNRSLIQLEDAPTFLKNCTFSNSQLIVIKTDNIIFYGLTRFENALVSVLKCYQSIIAVTGTALFSNNTGIRGAGMALYSCTLDLGPGANITFYNNSALEKGGAMYIEPSLSPFVFALHMRYEFAELGCFYRLFDCGEGLNYNLHFMNNIALFGGDDIYGASFNVSSCKNPEETVYPECKLTITGASSNLSSISSDPTRVCICDNNGQPKCENTYVALQVSSGETFSINTVPVSENFGTTSGTVFAYRSVGSNTIIPEIKPSNHISINSKECTRLNYSLYTNQTYVQAVIYLTTGYTNLDNVLFFRSNYTGLAPVMLNITFLPCPPGFLLVGDPQGCDCYHDPCNSNVQCTIIDGTGLFSWNSSLWMGNSAENKTVCNEFCPIDYCNYTGAWVNIAGNPDTQCAYNRAGRLCGGCKENYSLAIGSSHCIHCPNNNNLTLIIFFKLAGILLVLFITALNLTVTQKVVNELIFYANVIWIYQNIFFPKGLETNSVMVFLKTFIAWINLDFGIETCFAQNLTAFWKLWLQFIFPFYIWFIVGLIIMAARYSTRITRFLPRNRTIPVLATVLLLSYIKLVGITSSALKFSFIFEYPNDTNENPKPAVTAVWSVDGNLDYCGHPHILLFLAGLATLLFMWLPYTLMLLLMQWLRKVSH